MEECYDVACTEYKEPTKAEKLSQLLRRSDKFYRKEKDYEILRYRIPRTESYEESVSNLYDAVVKKICKRPKRDCHHIKDDERLETEWPRECGKHYNVFFSGGADSLSLVLRHLEKREKVALFIVNFGADIAPVINSIVDTLRDIYGSELIRGPFQLFDEVKISNGESINGLNQQPICAFDAAFIPDSLKKDAIATELAYCMNDDALSYITELKAIYENTMALKSSGYYEPYPPLEFPLIKHKHSENVEFIEAIEHKYRRMFIFVCGDRTEVFTLLYGKYKITMVESDVDYKENKALAPAGYIIIQKSVHFLEEEKALDDKDDKKAELKRKIARIKTRKAHV